MGNSFTADSKPEGTAAMLAYALGEQVEIGFHIKGNQSLDSLWNNPTASGTFTTDFGDHSVALPNNSWDFLSLQTFQTNSSSNTLGQEVARIQDFIGAADQGGGGATEIIVYGPWAGRGEGNWSRWYDEIPADPETRVAYSAQYHDVLYDEVEALFPGRVRLASAGKVIREIRDRILADEFPLDSTSDLYRDFIHLDAKLGRFIASTTMFTVISGMNPVGIPAPNEFNGEPIEDWGEGFISDELAREVQQIVWEVVTADKRSGVSPLGDLNVDTVLDANDQASWEAAYGARDVLTADANEDRRVDEADRQILLDVLDTGPTDLDGNGVLDRSDLLLWQGDYGRQGGGLLTDLNGDGVVNAIDYTVWRDDFEFSLTADFNGDGVATFADGEVWAAERGWARFLPQDANGNGVVDAADYTIWRDAINSGGVAVSAPEPAAVLLALLSLVVAFGRRVVV